MTNMEKSTFFPRELEYLGHILSEGTIRPNPRKVEALRYLKTPTSVAEVRSMLGLLGYFQSFIPDYARKAIPLTDLLRNQAAKSRQAIVWTKEHEEAVNELRTNLQDATLAIPQEEEDIKVETDASDSAVGGALYVRVGDTWKPVEFASQKLSPTQKKWPTREKEAYAIVYCVQKFAYYTKARAFTVYTDHQSLRWLFEATVGKLARWAILLSEYKMEVIWRKGSTNLVADYLSRNVEWPDPVEDYMVYAVSLEKELPTLAAIVQAQQECPPALTRGYLRRDGTFYYRNGIWVPPGLRTRVICACHIIPPLQHPGIKRTTRTVLRVFNWPNLHQDVTEYIKGCLTCQRLRANGREEVSRHPQDPLLGVFSVLHIDFWQCTYHGQVYKVLTMIDSASRWAEAEPVETASGPEVASALLRRWISRFGIPRRLVTDNGAAFTGVVLSTLAAQLGIERPGILPYTSRSTRGLVAWIQWARSSRLMSRCN